MPFLFTYLDRLRGQAHRTRRGITIALYSHALENTPAPRETGVAETSGKEAADLRVLVTGHHGYIGTVLAPFLQQAGHDVVGLDNFLYRECTFGPDGPAVPAIEKDLRDVEREDLEGFDAVVHLAGLSNDPLGNLNPRCTYEINHEASVRLALLAKEAGVSRFVFSSSCSTYGAAGDKILDETASFNPVTPYGESKVLVERDVTALASDTFSPVYMRNATAYGVSARMRFDLVLNNLVAWAFTTGRVHIKSDGTPWRPIVHIEDISRAVLAALEAPRERVHNQAFNVGQTSENYQVRDLAEIVRQNVPGCQIEYASDAGPDKRCYRADFSKIGRLLPAFRPRWTALDGVKELLAAYQAVGLRLEEFEGQRYRRIDHIQYLQRSGWLDEALHWRDTARRDAPRAGRSLVPERQA